MTHRHLRLLKFEPTEPVSETRIRTEPSRITRIPPPQTRADCGPKECPWCGKHVAMNLQWIGDADENDRLGGSEVRDVDGSASLRLGKERPVDHADVASSMRLRAREGRDGQQSSEGRRNELRVQPEAARDVRDARVRGVDWDADAMHEHEREAVPALRREGHSSLREVDGKRRLRTIPKGHGPEAIGEALDRPHQQRRELRTEQLPMGDSDPAGEKQAHISCPDCRKRVRPTRGVGGEDWHWEQYTEGADPSRMVTRTGRENARALRHCRPCVFSSSCRHHMHHRQSGQHPRTSTYESESTCALDVAAEGNHTLDEVGKYLGITRERVRQIEAKALAKVREQLYIAGYDDEDVQDMFASLMSVAHPETDGQSERFVEPEPLEDPWTAMAMRALERQDNEEVDEAAVLAAYHALAAETGERPTMGAVRTRAGFRGSKVTVWRVCAAAKGLPFWKGRAE